MNEKNKVLRTILFAWGLMLGSILALGAALFLVVGILHGLNAIL